MDYSISLPTHAEADVVVLGAGSAGCVAAIAAARQGARVLLVERHGFLGGTSTAVLDTFYGFYTPGEKSRQVVAGIATEVVGALRAGSGVLERPNTYGAGTGVTYHPEYLKVVWEQLTAAAGVQVLLYGFVQDVLVDDGRVSGLVVATKGGLRRVVGRCFVDASGDADLCSYAGFGYETAGVDDPAQTLTTTFKMVNVDLAARKRITKDEVHALMAQAAESGEYDLPRREGSDHVTPVDNMTATIMTRLQSVESRDGQLVTVMDPDFLSRAEMTGRRQALEYVRFLVDRVPGYEHAALSTFGQQIGIRETRRVYGDYRLTRDDVLSARRFDDQIGLCAAPIEDHHSGSDTRWHYLPDGRSVGIPLSSLVVRDAQNVLVAGRCFSATHDAHASVRSMAQCMAMGHAAGVTAALAAAEGTAARDVPAAQVRSVLAAADAILDEDDLRDPPDDPEMAQQVYG